MCGLGRISAMSRRDIESDWTLAANGAWFGYAKRPKEARPVRNTRGHSG